MSDSVQQTPAGSRARRGGGGLNPGRIITFYSYKGGTGRSMSLANVAWILASTGKRVLTVDWDLEAPGLHRYFSPFLRDKQLTATEGLIDFADEYRTKAMTPPAPGESLREDWYLEHADLSYYAVRLEWEFEDGGYIDFVPAGRQDKEYSTLVNSFNWKTFFTDLGGNRLLEAAKDIMREDYDYILIDSRTGVSDTSGICTVKMPDALVVCFTLNNQGIEGAASVANSVYEQRGDDIKIFPVPMRLDDGELHRKEVRSDYAKEQFFQFPNLNWDGKTPDAENTRKKYWNAVPVSYVTYYAYEEVLAAFAEKDAKIASMLASAERLTSYLTDGRVRELCPPDDVLRRKKLAEYEGSKAAPTDAEKLSEAAQTAFRRFSAQEQESARRLLLRLVRVPRADQRTEPGRRKIVVKEFGDGASTLVRKLLDARLIQLAGEEKDGEALVELVNDELLSWKELQKWIADERQFLLWRQQLDTHVAEWSEAGRTGDNLLTARALTEARRRLEQRPEALNRDEAEFIKASADAAHRQLWKVVTLVAAAVVILIIIPLLIYALLPGGRSLLNDRADARRLAVEAESRVDAGLDSPGLKDGDELQLGALLAIESARLAASEQATHALNRSLAVLARRVTSLKYDSDVVSVAWSADGKYVTTVSGRATNVAVGVMSAQATREDRVVEMHEVATGNRIHGPIPFKAGVQNFKVSDDGRYVAFSRIDSVASGFAKNAPQKVSIELLDVSSGNQAEVGEHEGRAPIYDMAFSADSRFMITSGDEPTAVLVDVAARKVLKTIRHKERVLTAAFSPDAKRVVTVTEDSYVSVYLVSDPEGAPRVGKPFKIGGVASKVLFTPDGKQIVTLLDGSARTYAQAWDVESGRGKSFEHGSLVRDVAVSGDSKLVATLGDDGATTVWDLADGQAVRGNIGITGGVNEIAFSPGANTYLAAFGDRPVACVWGLPGFDYVVLMTHEGRFNDVAFSPDGRTVATASADGSVRVWELGAGTDLQPCEHLTRNLTLTEWNRFLPDRPYRQTCSDSASAAP